MHKLIGKYFLFLAVVFAQTVSAQETDNTTVAITCVPIFAGFVKNAAADTGKYTPPYFSEKIDSDLVDVLKNYFDAEGHPITDTTNIAEITTLMSQIYTDIQTEKPAAAEACEEFIKATTGKCMQLTDARKCLSEVSAQAGFADAQKKFANQLSQAILQKSDMTKVLEVGETALSIQDRIRSFVTANFIAVYVSVLVFALLLLAFFVRRLTRKPAKNCPACQASLPSARIPTDFYEALIGGWTCPNCGAKWTYDMKRRN